MFWEPDKTQKKIIDWLSQFELLCLAPILKFTENSIIFNFKTKNHNNIILEFEKEQSVKWYISYDNYKKKYDINKLPTRKDFDYIFEYLFLCKIDTIILEKIFNIYPWTDNWDTFLTNSEIYITEEEWNKLPFIHSLEQWNYHYPISFRRDHNTISKTRNEVNKVILLKNRSY
jgi:hypothetical protein